MGRCAHHIELGRIFRILALKVNLLGSLGDVQAVLVAHLEGLSVCGNAARAADIEDADLAALQEIMGAEVLPAVDSLLNGNLLCGRHAAQRHHAVHVGIHGHYLVGHIQVLNQELLPQLLGGVALYILLVCGITNIHFLFLLFILSLF